MVEVLTGVNAGETAARWSPRWPEMRSDVPEGPGTRGRHGEARLVAADSRVASALVGEHLNGGAGWLLLLRAPAGADAHGEAALLRPKAKQRHGEMRRREGIRRRPKRGGGISLVHQK